MREESATSWHGDAQPVDLRERAVKGAGASVFAQIITFTAHTIGTIILARLLSPSDFGLVTMVSSFTLLLMNFGFNGFTELIIQRNTVNQVELSTMFWLHGALSLVLMLVFIGTGPVLSVFYNEPAVKGVTMVMALGILAQMLSTHHLAILKRNMEFRKVGLNQVVAGVSSVVLAVGMALGGCGYWAIVGRQLCIPVVMAIGAWIMCPWRPGAPGTFAMALSILKYAARVYGTFALGYFARNLDKVFLGRLHGADVLGNYDRAYYLSSMPAEQVVTPLHSVALATLSRLRNDPERYRTYYVYAVRTLAFVGVLAGLYLVLLGKDLVFVLLGGGWDQAGEVVVAFGPGVPAMLVYATHSWVHLSLGTPERWLRWNLASSALTFLLVVLAAKIGSVALAGALSGSLYVLMPLALWYAGRPIEIGLGAVVKAIWPFFGAGVATWMCLILFANCISATAKFITDTGAPLRILSVSLIGSVLYACFVALFYRSWKPIEEVIVVVRTVARR